MKQYIDKSFLLLGIIFFSMASYGTLFILFTEDLVFYLALIVLIFAFIYLSLVFCLFVLLINSPKTID